MEQQEPRKIFVKALHGLCKDVVLNDKFMIELKKHSNWEYIEEVLKFDEPAELNESVLDILKQNKIEEQIKKEMKNKDDMAKKVFIFLEFTRERSTCDEMVRILEDSGQVDVANRLKEFNASPRFIPLTYDEQLTITKADVPRSAGSKYFKMEQKPRGMFIIINNIKKDLEKESKRFKNIGEQLDIHVELFYDMSASDMKNKLTELSTDERLTKGDALIVMTISHGHDEKIEGPDRSELEIYEVIDIFAQTLKDKPKLFFFNCCRKKRKQIPMTVTQQSNENQRVRVLDNHDKDWENKHKKTMVCFACAEGDPAYHIPGKSTFFGLWYTPGHFTYFGQALSHCIAQYACDKNVQSIMNLTTERMRQFQELYLTKFSPEVRFFAMNREMYFNPGYYKD